MLSVINGQNIVAVSEESPMSPDNSVGVTMDINDLRALIHDEMSSAVADVERRLAQARELELSSLFGAVRSVHAEDLNINRHIIEGYTLTANSPGAGAIAWSSVHVVYLGVDYTIADANTTKRFSWFVKPGSGTAATLVSSDTMPLLGANDALIFVNNNGTAINALNSSISYAVGAGVITASEIADGAVTSAKTNFYTALSTAISDVGDAAALAQATADGSVTTYFQNIAPWPEGDATAGGAPAPATKTGDVWYNALDGSAHRWSGPGGSPVNSWIIITDESIGTALAAAQAAQIAADSKITTFYVADTTPPTALAVGDLWVVTNQGNQLRRATAKGAAGWSTLLLGDSAISGVSGAKIGTGISASNISGGTLLATLVGAGVAGAALGSATGTLAAANVGAGVAGAALGSATGTLAGASVGTGISATNVTTGTILAARVGTGVAGAALGSATGTLAAANVGAGVAGAALGSATGTLAAANVGAGVAGAALGSATGTLPGASVGTGISASNVTTGTLPSAQIGANSVTPAKINAAFHLLY